MIKPLKNKILVEQKTNANTIENGIFIPEVAKKKSEYCDVVAVAENISDVQVGDKVIISSYTCSEVKVDNKSYLLVNFEDVLGVLE